jgi:hypothetical protein
MNDALLSNLNPANRATAAGDVIAATQAGSPKST